MTKARRVVITGLGALTPIGNDVESFWQSLTAGKSGLGRITKFDPTGCDCQIAGEVKGLDLDQHFDRKEQRKMEDFTKFALIVARQAVKDSGILDNGFDRQEIGCILGVGIGGIGFIQEQVTLCNSRGPGRVSPLFIPKSIANIAAGQVSIDLGIKGASLAVVTACAAGTHALGEAFYLIQRGDATAMIAGGTEAAICQVAIAGFSNMQALASGYNDTPEQGSRPFDARRSGFVMGEGAGAMILEEYEHAKARGAHMYAEIVGYGLSSDAHHITAPAPEGEGGARAMEMAMRRCGLPLSDIKYINAHGTSTPLNDKNETLAIKRTFGELAPTIPVSSNKSMIGHLLGAAGAVEAVATVLTMRDGLIPPTINYTEPDPECDLDYVPNVARKADVPVAMSNSLGFGGHNCSIIFSRTGF